MKVTKYEHACLTIGEENDRLIINPGIFSESCTDFKGVSGVVVTHVHPDHCDTKKLAEISRQNPGIVIYTVQEVIDQLQSELPFQSVGEGQQVVCGPFTLDFFGGQHAAAHPSYPTAQNVGVLINKRLYYPGDSFTVPHQPIEILAVPASAPWLKIAEAMDFITAVKPKQVFPTHDALLSSNGQSITDPWLQKACDAIGASFTRFEVGAAITL